MIMDQKGDVVAISARYYPIFYNVFWSCLSPAWMMPIWALSFQLWKSDMGWHSTLYPLFSLLQRLVISWVTTFDLSSFPMLLLNSSPSLLHSCFHKWILDPKDLASYNSIDWLAFHGGGIPGDCCISAVSCHVLHDNLYWFRYCFNTIMRQRRCWRDAS